MNAKQARINSERSNGEYANRFIDKVLSLIETESLLGKYSLNEEFDSTRGDLSSVMEHFVGLGFQCSAHDNHVFISW